MAVSSTGTVGSDYRHHEPLRDIRSVRKLPARYIATPTFVGTLVDGYDTLVATLKTHEYYATSLTGANNDFVVVARKDNTSPLTIALVDPAANSASLSVSYATNAIAVSLATDSGGVITSTASDVVALLNSSATTRGLVYASLKEGNTGAGVVTALGAQGLAGWVGATPTLDVSLQTSDDNSTWATVGSFTQATAVGASETKVFTGLKTWVKWVATVGTGTDTPTVAFSVSGKARLI